MVGCGAPRFLQEFYAAEFIQYNTPPVLWRSRRFQTASTFSAILITQHSKLAILIPSQPVWAKQTMSVVIDGRDGPFGLHRGGHYPVNILYALRPLCSFASHLFLRLTRLLI